MARTYLFSCEKCGYEAKVAGGSVEGTDARGQTIHCVDCHELYDAVLFARMPVADFDRVPWLEEVAGRLQWIDRTGWEWRAFEQACPRSREHVTKEWKHPGRCPICATYLEPSALPFRVWD
jgi:hypothetical protein